jgi:putative membrane protein
MLEHDPRVFFAAERTLLAWVRTGLTLIATGFLVARFGLILRLLRPDIDPGSHAWAGPLGVSLALLGSIGSGVSAWQHRKFYRTLPKDDLPRNYRPEPGLLLGYGTAAAGFVLAIVLVL